ncbi:MAG: Stp1/IreP family PP2C-type Ser/Thr phosphatase [Clostridia bacterium]|nr:Stp1/IreP family PP2C-type Ser/Thr phosphatase [Clostridia bacterium]
MRYFGRSVKGRRQHNEDSFYTPDCGDLDIAIVADGMGGHRAGDVASALAMEEMLLQMRRSRLVTPEKALREAVLSANRRIYEYGELTPECSGLGTTIVAALLGQDAFSICNVGDSRIYLYSDGALTRLTRDHSLVADLVRCGAISDVDARTHPYRNVITRAVGTSDAVEVDTSTHAWREDDMLLLCSDGLCGTLDDDSIRALFDSTPDARALCDALVESALESGSTDNITAVIVVNAGGAQC